MPVGRKEISFMSDGFPSHTVNGFAKMRSRFLKNRKKGKKLKKNGNGGHYHAFGWKPTKKSKKQAAQRLALAEHYNGKLSAPASSWSTRTRLAPTPPPPDAYAPED
jgi:hypothetical protein